MIIKSRPSISQKNNDDTNNMTVVVPIHKSTLSKYEMVSLRQMQKVFASKHFSVVCPAGLNDFVETVFDGSNFTTINFEKSRFNSIRAYNRLLTDIDFFKRFEAFSFILICQLDVFVVADDLDMWMSYDYDFIGAPMFEGYEKAPLNNLKYKRTLNGGLSLRKVRSAIDVLQQIRFRFCPISVLLKMEESVRLKLVRLIRDGLIFNYNNHYFHPVINEDLFWSYVVPNLYKWFKVPDPEFTTSFAFDTHPQFLFRQNKNKLPLGIHAWWKYDMAFIKEVLQLESAYPEIIAKDVTDWP